MRIEKVEDRLIPTLEQLLKTYAELNKLSAAPGDKCHMLATSINFIKDQIRSVIKDIKCTL